MSSNTVKDMTKKATYFAVVVAAYAGQTMALPNPMPQNHGPADPDAFGKAMVTVAEVFGGFFAFGTVFYGVNRFFETDGACCNPFNFFKKWDSDKKCYVACCDSTPEKAAPTTGYTAVDVPQ